jgi:isoleucyl-tRNA synthetase
MLVIFLKKITTYLIYINQMLIHVVLVSDSGKPMYREADLIDVWFDSGAMPYAQLHYPFENKEKFEKFYPADFIAEGSRSNPWMVLYFACHSYHVI